MTLKYEGKEYINTTLRINLSDGPLFKENMELVARGPGEGGQVKIYEAVLEQTELDRNLDLAKGLLQLFKLWPDDDRSFFGTWSKEECIGTWEVEANSNTMAFPAIWGG